jgi:hypothetical protein
MKKRLLSCKLVDNISVLITKGNDKHQLEPLFRLNFQLELDVQRKTFYIIITFSVCP